MIDRSKFVAVFMGKLLPCFRSPTSDAQNSKAMVELYYAELSKFAPDVLADAAHRILTTRKDPFFPTLAECLDVCRKVRRDRPANVAALTAPVDGWEFTPGDL